MTNTFDFHKVVFCCFTILEVSEVVACKQGKETREVHTGKVFPLSSQQLGAKQCTEAMPL